MLFLALTAISLTIHLLTGKYVEVHGFFFGFTIFLGIVSTVVIIVTVFATMGKRQCQRERFTGVKSILKRITLQEQKIENYKIQFEESLTKLYPDYEKEIFKSISPSDAEGLSVYLAKYPELKFSGILTMFTQGLCTLNKGLYELKDSLNVEYERITNAQQDEWYLFKVEVPSHIQECL